MGFDELVVTAIVALILIEFASHLIVRTFPINPTSEFMKLDVGILDRFVTFDLELGHVPIPNTKKIDRDITGKQYDVVCTYDEFASRVSQLGPSTEVLCSTFGDSFCQCRGVQDHETWQSYLEQRTKKRVLNFGVGGYGLDQAYLRYLRNRDHDLGKTIIYAVSPCTIERVIGVYKNYIEFGNFLGIKPRFIEVDGELELVAPPIRSKSDLLELETCKRKLRTLDENYEGYFKKYCPKFPFTYYVFINWKQYVIDVIKAIQNRRRWEFFLTCFGGLDYIKSKLITDRRNDAYRRKNLYFRKLFAEKDDFFISLVKVCKKACNEDGRSALFVILPDYTNISFMREHGHYYRNLIDRLRKEVGIPVFDSYEIFHDCNPQEIFLKDNYSGHHAARGNEILSEHLARFIQDQDAEHLKRGTCD